MSSQPKVWLSERAYPTVRMKFEGLDITMERRGVIESPHYMRGQPNWIVTSITLPSGSGIMPSDAEFRCNNTTLLRAAETTYKETPEGATFPKHSPRRVVA